MFRLLICLCVLSGCRAIPGYMREVSPVRLLKAPADQALVVFVRRSTGNKGLPAHVMDQNANFLGTAVAGGHFSVLRPPGKQHFIVWADDDDILTADLAPGFVYFIEVKPELGGQKARFTLKGSHRGTDIFPFKEEWIEETQQYRVAADAVKDEPVADATMRREKLEDALERLKHYVGIDLVEHSLVQTDGHSSVGVPGAVRVVAAPPPMPLAKVAAVAVPVVAPSPAPGFVPEEFPTVRRGYARGSMLRVKLKTGTTWLGELMRETKLDLKLKVGPETQLLDFADIASIEQLGPAK